MLYRIGPDWPASASALEAALAAEPFTECTATQQKSTGWVPPRGEEYGAMCESVAGQWILRFKSEERVIPGATMQRHMAQKIEACIAQVQGTIEKDLK